MPNDSSQREVVSREEVCRDDSIACYFDTVKMERLSEETGFGVNSIIVGESSILLSRMARANSTDERAARRRPFGFIKPTPDEWFVLLLHL